MKKSKKMIRIFRNGMVIVFVLSLLLIIVEILSLTIMWATEHFPVFGLIMFFIAIGAFICLGVIGLIMEHSEDNKHKGDE